MKILVTGGKGQLGCEINKLSSKFNCDWLFSDTNNFDISDLKNIDVFLNKSNPDIIINCAAYTSVDNAEVNFEIANTINHKSVELIAKWSNKNNCKLIHISTDYVYDGTSLIPVNEDITLLFSILSIAKPNTKFFTFGLLPFKVFIKTSSFSPVFIYDFTLSL